MRTGRPLRSGPLVDLTRARDRVGFKRVRTHDSLLVLSYGDVPGAYPRIKLGI
jgi:hypothetical protein